MNSTTDMRVCPQLNTKFFKKYKSQHIYSYIAAMKGGELLVLSRKRDEKILFQFGEEDIELTVVRIDANKVRLGIKAGDNVTILREELLNGKTPKAVPSVA